MTKIITFYDYQPIPYRGYDWSAHFEWDEGGEWFIGRGGTEENAVINLLRCAEACAGSDDVVNLALEGWKATKAPAWQPIETAPKDGTQILVFDAKSDPRAYVCFWANHSHEWAEAGGEQCEAYDATHWMPLPPPPAD